MISGFHLGYLKDLDDVDAAEAYATQQAVSH